MTLNMGPNKTAILHFTNKRRQIPLTYQVPTANGYKYLGKQIQMRSNHTAHLNAWKVSQVKLRFKKFRNSTNMVSKAAFTCPHSFAQFRHALITVARGNLYGLADHTTPIYEDYARGELGKWEIQLRKVIRRVLRLPTNGFPNDLLHRATGIPSIATMLN